MTPGKPIRSSSTRLTRVFNNTVKLLKLSDALAVETAGAAVCTDDRSIVLVLDFLDCRRKYI